MAATHAKYPDDETTLFYGLSILGSIREGTKGFEMQGRAVALFESVYAHDKQHPGVLHYLIHVYDDPVHAKSGLAAARTYARTAALELDPIFRPLASDARFVRVLDRTRRDVEAQRERARQRGLLELKSLIGPEPQS